VIERGLSSGTVRSVGAEPRTVHLVGTSGRTAKIVPPAVLSKKQRDVRPAEPQMLWSLLTGHGLALLYLAANPDATVLETAAAVDLMDRRIADIIRDLVKASTRPP